MNTRTRNQIILVVGALLQVQVIGQTLPSYDSVSRTQFRVLPDSSVASWVYARSWVNVREYLLGNVQAPQYDTVSIDFISQKRVNISHLNEIYNDPHKIPVTVWKLKWISDDNIIYIYETSTGLYSYYDLDDYVTYERILSYPPLTGMRWTYHIDMTAIIDSIYTYEYENRSYDAIVMKYRHVGDLIKGLFEGATDIWANGLGLVYRKGVAGGFAGSEQYVVEYILIDVKYRKDP